MYKYDERPQTRIAASSEPLLDQMRSSEYSVLVGRNNCGKSYLLKSLTQKWGENVSFLGPARYQNFNLLGYFTPTRTSRKTDRWNQWLRQWRDQTQNLDNSPLNLQQAIAELSDEQRVRLTEIVKLLLNVDLEIKQTVASNSMSQKYISCGGHNISYTSAGFRLIVTLLTSLLDSEYDTFLIDEPELGISPEAQGILADFLFDRDHRTKYFPHIKTLVLATHSTVFLDRKQIQNNFTVEKVGDEIRLSQVQSQVAFSRVHFFLLGNRFETLYLPSAIVIVEGKTDYRFVERVLTTKYPLSRFSVIEATNDTRVKEVLNVARGLLADFQRSPYKDRIFVVLDAVHAAGLVDQVVAMGVARDNVIVWPKNGIEYYYPPQIVDDIFGAGPEVQIDGDRISRHGIVLTKSELSDQVIARVEATTAMHPDFQSGFLARLERLGITRGSA